MTDKHKMIMKGGLAQLKPLLFSLAREAGLYAFISSGRPDWDRRDYDHVSIGLAPDSEHRQDRLGTITLQGLPNTRAQVTFIKSNREGSAQFEVFCRQFKEQAKALGFLTQWYDPIITIAKKVASIAGPEILKRLMP